MASQVTNYKCPACTGPLHFVGASGKLECDYCGAQYEVADIEKLYADKEGAAAAAAEKGARSPKRRRPKLRQTARRWRTWSLRAGIPPA